MCREKGIGGGGGEAKATEGRADETRREVKGGVVAGGGGRGSCREEGECGG